MEPVESVDDILAHFGKQGMKWGVRTSRSGEIKPRATLSRSDNRTMALLREPKLTDNMYSEVYSRSASRIRQGTRKINKDPKFAGKNFKVDSTNRREYYAAYSKMVSSQLNATVGSATMNPFRKVGMATKKLELHFDYDVSKELSPRITIRPTDTRTGTKVQKAEKKVIKNSVKHADESLVDEIEVFLVTDENGYIQDLDVPGSSDLTQSDNPADDILMHYGKLGMHWGRRTAKSTEASSPDAAVENPVTIYSRPGKGIVNTKGGEGRLVSDDAKKAAEYGQIARKSGSDALSNAQLRVYTDRVNLQQSYAKIASQKNEAAKSNGRKFVEDAIKNERASLLKGKKGPLLLAGIAIGAALIGTKYAGKHSSGSAKRTVDQVVAQVAAKNAAKALGSEGGKSTVAAGADYVRKHSLGSPVRTVAQVVALSAARVAQAK